MNGNPGFRPARGASRRCNSAVWRGCSTSFGDICRKPTADKILTRPRLGAGAMATNGEALGRSSGDDHRGSFRIEAPEQLVAYVNLARLAVEAAAFDLMQLAQRSVGLQAFMRPNPIERISRDLATYLRQPGPDRALTDAAAWVLAQPVPRRICGDDSR
jgi:hypothetical protein